MKAAPILAILFFIVSCGDTSSDPPGRPDIQVDPTTHNFGNIDFNQSSLPFEVTISNPGTASLSVSNISLSDTRNFTLNVSGGVSPCVSETPIITAGGNCTVEITFAPQSLGTVSGSLIISSNDPDEPVAGAVLAGNAIPLPTSGIFVSTGQIIGNNTTNSVILGDVDDDGDIDIVEGNDLVSLVWRNDGAGIFPVTFTDSGQRLQVFGSGRTIALSLGDIDNDGDLDIAEGRTDVNLVWMNDGFGVFNNSSPALGPNNAITSSLSLGDLNGDFDLDLVFANSGSVNQVWRNLTSPPDNNPGIFTLSVQPFIRTDLTRSVALGDLDGDFDLDMVIGNFGQLNRVWINTNGIFQERIQPNFPAFNPGDTTSVALGDLDGDGDLDIVEGNSNDFNRVWINTNDLVTGLPTGIYVQQLQPSFAVAATSSIALGDVDGDGDLDIIEGNSNDFNRVWLNRDVPDGLPGSFIELPQPNFTLLEDTRSIALGDVDGNGSLDIIAGNFGGSNRVWLNQ
jgi:hypothetical protein